ncbi:MAG: IS66 family transposase [Cyclobacteriaceae bacterium]|nr:IS66 family transposase [Cyclobacteriaceae bacterium]
MNLSLLSKKELITILQAVLARNEALSKQVVQLVGRVEELELQVIELKAKKDSTNSSIPPSQDQNSAQRNRSLRKKSTRNKGGQKGHKGYTLEMTQTPAKTIDYVPKFCRQCGEDLERLSSICAERRQVVDIPPISPIYTEHRAYSKTCQCGYVTKGNFPTNVKAPIQYGAGVESLAAYFSARQYLPYRRMKECFQDLFGVSISEGSLVSAVRRMAHKSLPIYHRIKQNITHSPVVGADETGAKVNGKKAWFWTWQDAKNTFITVSDTRGFAHINQLFPQGLTTSILVSDCWAAQLKTPAAGHQLCMAHLQRELNFFIELYDDRWAKDLKKLLLLAQQFKSEISDYNKESPKRSQLECRLEKLLAYDIDKQPIKIKPFQKRIIKYKNYLFPFLYHQGVPADNNASERAIRNVKVKQKISGQFLSQNNASDFAIIRSVIDTAIKNGVNIFNSLKLVANLAPE